MANKYFVVYKLFEGILSKRKKKIIPKHFFAVLVFAALTVTLSCLDPSMFSGYFLDPDCEIFVSELLVMVFMGEYKQKQNKLNKSATHPKQFDYN